MKNRTPLLFVVALTIGLVYFFVIRPSTSKYDNLLDEEYSGKIDEIEIRDGFRGAPHVKINNHWILLKQQLLIKETIQIGDSVVKSKGTSDVLIFRKTTNNEYRLLE